MNKKELTERELTSILAEANCEFIFDITNEGVTIELFSGALQEEEVWMNFMGIPHNESEWKEGYTDIFDSADIYDVSIYDEYYQETFEVGDKLIGIGFKLDDRSRYQSVNLEHIFHAELKDIKDWIDACC